MKRTFIKIVSSCEECPNFTEQDMDGPAFCRILKSNVYYKTHNCSGEPDSRNVFENLCPLEEEKE